MNLSKITKKDWTIIGTVVLVVLIFVVGYFLRAYFSLTAALPFSPYEAFRIHVQDFFLGSGRFYDMFSARSAFYPTAYLISGLLEPLLGNFYIMYVLGGAIFFLLGRDISGTIRGGVLAFLAYAVAGENLLQYVSTINPASLSYVLMWLGVLSVFRYLRFNQDVYLVIFAASSIITSTSYHTGGLVFAFFVLAVAVYTAFISPVVDRKLLLSSLLALGFYVWYVTVADFSYLGQLLLFVRGDFTDLLIQLGAVVALIFLVWVFLRIFKKEIVEKLMMPLIVVSIFVATFLIFSESPILQGALGLTGINQYYVSAVSLNNYVAQFLLLHVYILFIIPLIAQRKPGPVESIFSIWIGTLGAIVLALFSSGYYSRLLDYSFPLAFVAFGFYWAQHKKVRVGIVAATLGLLIVSQLMIYQDGYSMRRYYTHQEIASAAEAALVVQRLQGVVVSDLRTTALLSMFNTRNILFSLSESPIHYVPFYDYKNFFVNWVMHANTTKPGYVVLTSAMRNIVYSTNFTTKPLAGDVYEYYRLNYPVIYDDGTIIVYQVFTPEEVTE